MCPLQALDGQEGRVELLSALRYILLLGTFAWTPLVYVLAKVDPLALFQGPREMAAALMFFTGAVIANSTAVGGGIVFNPMLQFVFGVGGLSALVLAITVQCAGMSSGSYGWYRRGELEAVRPGQWVSMGLCVTASTALFSATLLILTTRFSGTMLVIMKMVSALVSFYVFSVLWFKMRDRAVRQTPGSAMRGSLRVDWRIYPWLVFGSLLNVYTAVGVGELCFSHIMKYYKAPAQRAVAVGVVMQAVSVLAQTAFNVAFLSHAMELDLACIGLFFTMVGGRMAPVIITHRWIRPYIRHVLAFTALAMGLTSAFMLVSQVLRP